MNEKQSIEHGEVMAEMDAIIAEVEVDTTGLARVGALIDQGHLETVTTRGFGLDGAEVLSQLDIAVRDPEGMDIDDALWLARMLEDATAELDTKTGALIITKAPGGDND